MPQAWENWLGLGNSCVYYARQTREIYRVLPWILFGMINVAFKGPIDDK